MKKKSRTSSRRCVPHREIPRVRLDYLNGTSTRELANRYGVSMQVIRGICKGTSHASFDGPISTQGQRKEARRGLRSSDNAIHDTAYSALDARIRHLSSESDPVDRLFSEFRRVGFPYRRRCTARLPTNLRKLRNSLTLVKGVHIPVRTVGVRAVSSFHPHIEHVRFRKHRSPYDVFCDDVRLIVILRRLVSRGVFFGLAEVRRAIELSTHVVSNYRPNAAMTLFRRYQATSILDPCMGWGGRLFGAVACNLPYIGIDPSSYAIAGNKAFVKTLLETTGEHLSVEIIQGCAEDVLAQRKFSVDMVFTSPPYYDTEDYSSESTQSHRRYRSLECWKKGFLRPLVEGSAAALLRGGVLAMNINRDLEADLHEFAVGCGLIRVEKLLYLTPRNTYGCDSAKRVGSEPIVVYRRGIQPFTGDD